MSKKRRLTWLAFVAVVLVVFGCQSKQAEQKPATAKSDEEAGVQLSPNETYDYTRNGVRLVMSYNEEAQAFVGTVQNTTNETIKNVRVEVHLSDGTELGPTTPVDLAPGQKQDVKLSTEGKTFTWWKAHPEAGKGEQEEGESEHGEEHGKEHAREHGEREMHEKQ